MIERHKTFALALAIILMIAFWSRGQSQSLQSGGTAGDGQVQVWRATGCAGQPCLVWETPAGGGGSVPAGSILLVNSGTCPAGFAEVAGLDGKTLIGTLAAHADVGTGGGADNITPTGTNSAPTFTGDALAGHTHTFTGNALAGGTRKGGTTNPASIIENGAAVTGSNSSDSAGTPSGAVSAPTFTGNSFDNRSAFVRVIFCSKT